MRNAIASRRYGQGRKTRKVARAEVETAKISNAPVEARASEEPSKPPNKEKSKLINIKVETKDRMYSTIIGKLKEGLGMGMEPAITEAKESLASDLVLKLRQGEDGEEIRRRIGCIIESQGRAVITQGST